MKTIRTAKLCNLELRLVDNGKQYIGLIFSGGPAKAQIEGSSADDVWRRLHDEAGKSMPKYFGFDCACARFLRLFPNGFCSADYESAERNYKVRAKSTLDQAAPVEKAATGTGYAEAIWSSYQTNLVFPFEKMKVHDSLRSPAADDFIKAHPMSQKPLPISN